MHGLSGRAGARIPAACAAGGEEAPAMTLLEISASYRAAAQPLRVRLRELRQQMKIERDPERMFWLKRRTAVLTEMLRQMNELAELTQRYYEKGYYRNEKYRI